MELEEDHGDAAVFTSEISMFVELKSEDRTITELNYCELERRTAAVMVAAWEASEGSGLDAASTINRHNRRNQK